MKQERNAKCACGSGLKYKKCCFKAQLESSRLTILERREQMRERAEKLRRQHELDMDYKKANPPSLRGVSALSAAIALAMMGGYPRN